MTLEINVMAHVPADLFANQVGLWVGFIFSLLIFSALAGENALARLAQHILVGASLGYVAVLVLRDVLQPRLFTPLWQASGVQLGLWAPLILGVLLWAAGLDRVLERQKPLTVAPLWRRILYSAGMVPVALLLGVGSAVALIGVVQGTLLPQFVRAASTGIPWSASPAAFLAGGLTLLLTTATLLHLSVRLDQAIIKQSGLMHRLLSGWIWLGKHALWVASGVIFARLVAARLSLLIGRLEFFLFSLKETHLWQWAETLWRSLVS